MNSAGWDTGLAVGLAEVDHEHSLQVALIRALDDAVRAGKGGEAGLQILAQLLDYTEAHFLTEEMLMRLKGAASYDAHVADHDRLIALLNELKTSVESGRETIRAETVDSLKEWLTLHVRQWDRKLPTDEAPT